MKTILLITASSKHYDRAQNQIKNLNLFNNILEQKNIVPYFLIDTDFDKKLIQGFQYIEYNKEDIYTNLYKKLMFGYKHIFNNVEFDFLIKIDDDTYIDFNSINVDVFKDYDYTGYFIVNEPSSGSITINFLSNIESINLYPPFCRDLKRYAAGSCYILSKYAVKILINYLFPHNIESFYINEDQLYGYILQIHNVTVKDISIKTDFTKTNNIFLTDFSMHPVNSIIFKKLIGTSLSQIENTVNRLSIFNTGIRNTINSSIKDHIIASIKTYINSIPQRPG